MSGALLVLLLVVLLLGPPAARSQQASPNTATPTEPAGCPDHPGYARCQVGCEPGRLIFLPCMAVGARAMAGCRQREVAACLRACATRHCS